MTEIERQLKGLADLLMEGAADLKAGRVHTPEEAERMLQELRAKRISEKAKIALKAPRATPLPLG